jgi:hypothetical protein
LVVAAAPGLADLVSDSFQHAKQLRLNASDCHATGAGVCSRSVNASGSAHAVPFGPAWWEPAERDRARQPAGPGPAAEVARPTGLLAILVVG